VRSCNSNVLLGVHSILGSQCSKAFKNPVANRCVTHRNVGDEVDEPIFWLIDITDDEGAAVQALAQARADLRRVGVAHKVELYDWARSC
jgi:hypothetical protein